MYNDGFSCMIVFIDHLVLKGCNLWRFVYASLSMYSLENLCGTHLLEIYNHLCLKLEIHF